MRAVGGWLEPGLRNELTLAKGKAEGHHRVLAQRLQTDGEERLALEAEPRQPGDFADTPAEGERRAIGHIAQRPARLQISRRRKHLLRRGGLCRRDRRCYLGPLDR